MRRLARNLMLFGGLAGAPSSARADDPAPAPLVDPSYELGIGDVLRVDVVTDPEMSGSLPVGSDGTVDLPVAGRVKVVGYTLDGAKEQIEAHLKDGYLKNPQVTLSVLKLVSKILKVTGGVATPGEYPMTSHHFLVSQLLVRSGGLVDPSTPTAEVWRDVAGQREVIPVDVVALSRGERAADLELIPGDTLVVPPAQQIFVDGNVQKPGGYMFRDGTTLSMAVAAAGGTNGTALTTKVKLIRGEEQQIVNLHRVLKGLDADVMLRPGDHVYIPESPI